MSNPKTPEQIVAEMRSDSSKWITDWTQQYDEADLPGEIEIGLDGGFTIDQLRAIVAVREKELSVLNPAQDAAKRYAEMVRNACAYEDWNEEGCSVAERIEQEFGIKKGTSQ